MVLRNPFFSLYLFHLLQQLVEALLRFFVYVIVVFGNLLGVHDTLLNLPQPEHHGIKIIMNDFFLRVNFFTDGPHIGS